MTEQENRQVYETLMTVLSENSLVWVIRQVEEQVRLGKVIEREIETLTDSRTRNSVREDKNDRFRKGPKVKLPVTVDYTSAEKLEILIEAIQCALIDTADIENSLIDFLERQTNNQISEIQFYREDSEYIAQTISQQRAGLRSLDVDKLKRLLELLRKKVNEN